MINAQSYQQNVWFERKQNNKKWDRIQENYNEKRLTRFDVGSLGFFFIIIIVISMSTKTCSFKQT